MNRKMVAISVISAIVIAVVGTLFVLQPKFGGQTATLEVSVVNINKGEVKPYSDVDFTVELQVTNKGPTNLQNLNFRGKMWVYGGSEGNFYIYSKDVVVINQLENGEVNNFVFDLGKTDSLWYYMSNIMAITITLEYGHSTCDFTFTQENASWTVSSSPLRIIASNIASGSISFRNVSAWDSHLGGVNVNFWIKNIGDTNISGIVLEYFTTTNVTRIDDYVGNLAVGQSKFISWIDVRFAPAGEGWQTTGGGDIAVFQFDFTCTGLQGLFGRPIPISIYWDPTERVFKDENISF